MYPETVEASAPGSGGGTFWVILGVGLIGLGLVVAAALSSNSLNTHLAERSTNYANVQPDPATVQTRQDIEFDNQVMKEIEAENRTYPKQQGVTRIDGMKYDLSTGYRRIWADGTIVDLDSYKYSQASKARWGVEAKRNLVKALCQDYVTLKRLQHNVELIFTYHGRDGGIIVQVSLTRADCGI
jgi:hypothetical protein